MEIELDDCILPTVSVIDTTAPATPPELENTQSFASYICSFFLVPFRVWVLEEGGAQNSEYLASHGLTIICDKPDQIPAIEPNDAKIEVAEEKIIGTPIQAPCEYDAVFCSFIFDTMEEEKARTFLQSIPSYVYMCIETNMTAPHIRSLVESADYTVMETQTPVINTWAIAIRNRDI